LLQDGEVLTCGALSCRVIATPGHTPDSVCYLIGDALFVGDALFQPDVGSARCDFPGASAAQSFASVRRLFELPGATRVMVGHDYPPESRDPMHETDIGLERTANLHLKESITLEEFVQFRDKRDRTLPLPELFFFALQVNVNAGRLPAADAYGRRFFKVPIRSGSAGD
jgi:glyoxylase-like metal-dependent hydrolase (beta-lactamase superfamily II)